MFEFIAGFAVGYLFTWPALVLMVLLGVLFEHWDARGFAVALAIVAGVSAFFIAGVSLTSLAVISALYLVVGSVWSFWRYHRFVNKQAEIIRSSTNLPEHKQSKAERLHPKYHTDTIVAWIVIWPFSAIENISSDVIDFIVNLVKTTFKNIYNSSFNSATKDLI